MRVHHRRVGVLLGALLALAGAGGARADFELSDAQGRRILLKDDGTWRYVDGNAVSAEAAASAASAPKKDDPPAELTLNDRRALGGGCAFSLTLKNTLPYEIRSLVLDFSVLRANGVAYRTNNMGFGTIRPGDQRTREVRFDGIACDEVATLKVSGGDRCEMGELHKFSDVKGECLARVKLLPTTLLKFEK